MKKNKKDKTEIDKYIPSKIESKWQKIWDKQKVYSPNLDKAEKPFYNLMMFPYPSAEGMHVGNMYAFTGSDIYGRYKRMRGFGVFEPIGLDGFGIHSENYALKIGKHPMEQAKVSEKNFYRQLHVTGNGFDWSRTVETYDPKYYKWTQWIFIQLFKAGLAYRKKAPVNFCSSCKTVLADEQAIKKETETGVVNVCERCGTIVEKRELEQWFFRITDYAERLLKNLDNINWSEKVKIAQREWIGKSEGIIEKWKVEGMDLELETFTTWPHTTFGATFIVIAPEHPVIKKLVQETKYEEGAKKFIEEVRQDKIKDPHSMEKEKKGFFLGRYAINHLTGFKMPIYIANFAIMEYGTGIVKGAPAHDQRDFEFAKKFNIPLILVVRPKGSNLKLEDLKEAYVGSGVMTENTKQFEGMPDDQARKAVAEYSIKLGHARKKTNYHLRDWLISRQRYWSPPIPMIYCSQCGSKDKSWFTLASQGEALQGWNAAGWFPVPEEQLPVELPYIKDYKPLGTGKSPLANHKEFYEVSCPECGGKAQRETDVSDTFLDSAWYFFRYLATERDDVPFPSEKFKEIKNLKFKIKNSLAKRGAWLPVVMYIGGAEHSVLHLLYSRFITMVFKDLGFIDFEEPFQRFYAHGLLVKDGAKMSKSKGNVVIPDEYIRKYGADTLRTYLMFAGPFDQGGDFRDTGIEGMNRFLKRVWTLVLKNKESGIRNQESNEGMRVMHKTIKRVTNDMENLRYNTAIAGLMEYYNFLFKQREISGQEVEVLIKLLAPFAPHMTEELWRRIRNQELRIRNQDRQSFNSIHLETWPAFDPKLLEEKEVTIVVQINGKVRETIRIKNQELGIKNKVEEEARKSEKVSKHLEDKNVKKVIYVEGKIINFVTE